MLAIRSSDLRRGAVLLGAAAVIAIAVGCTPKTEVTVAGNAQTSQGIAVSGEGTASVQPDLALLNLGIEVTAPTVAEARAQAADAMSDLQSAVTGQGVEEKDIQTQFFNIYPQYSYAEGSAPQITGFTLSNVVQVKVRDIDGTSEVLDAAIEAGGDAVRVNGVTFTVENPSEHIDDARRAAVENAKANAQVLADAAGVELGAPISINESVSDGSYPPIPYAGRSEDSQAGGGTSISPGEQELTVYVTVVYGIAE